MKIDYRAIVNKAWFVTKDVPESARTTAFNHVLNYMLIDARYEAGDFEILKEDE